MTPARPRIVRLRDLTALRFPVGAVASIAHRLSGVLLLPALPLLAVALDRSLAGGAEYAALLDVMRTPWARVVTVVLTWAAAYHLFAGVRHLLMDVGAGSRLRAARWSAKAVLLAGLVVAAIAAIGGFA